HVARVRRAAAGARTSGRRFMSSTCSRWPLRSVSNCPQPGKYRGDVERFTPEAFAPPDDRLEAVTIAPLTAPGRVQASFFYVAAGGRIARHRATTPQILAVVEGEGL